MCVSVCVCMFVYRRRKGKKAVESKMGEFQERKTHVKIIM